MESPLARDEGMACDWRRSGAHQPRGEAIAPGWALEAGRRLLAAGFRPPDRAPRPGELSREIGPPGITAAWSIPVPARSSRRRTSRVCRGGAPRRRIAVERRGHQSLRRAAGLGLKPPAARSPRVTCWSPPTGIPAGSPCLARRVVPVGSSSSRPSRSPPHVRRRLIPTDRMLSDTKNLLYYFRLSPDGRLVFGGRAAFVPTALERSRAMLREGMLEVFPSSTGSAWSSPGAGPWGSRWTRCRTRPAQDGSPTRWATAATVSRWPLAGAPGRAGDGGPGPGPDWPISLPRGAVLLGAGRGFCRSRGHITGQDRLG